MVGGRLEGKQVGVAEAHDHLLPVANLNQRRAFEGPFENPDDFVRCVEAENHADQQRRAALDQHPTEIFEMFEKCFDGAAAIFLQVVETRLFGGIGHVRTSLRGQSGFGSGRL